jgi:phosphohistidine phosphatase
MKLYFLRHGIAADRTTWEGMDSDRPLTSIGRRRVDQIARNVARRGIRVDRIISSPYLRAQQTAEIVARRLDRSDELEVDRLLRPGFDLRALVELTYNHRLASSLLLVGHEPDFANTICELIGGGRIKLRKAGFARVDADLAAPASGELVWLIPPKLLGGMRADPK